MRSCKPYLFNVVFIGVTISIILDILRKKFDPAFVESKSVAKVPDVFVSVGEWEEASTS